MWLARGSNSTYAHIGHAEIERASATDVVSKGSKLLSSTARHNMLQTLRGTLRHSQRTHDMEKARIAMLQLAHYARDRTRFFLAVGLSSTHVQGVTSSDFRICSTDAAEAEETHPLDPSLPLAPSRSAEYHPPLVTWQNWDLPRFDIGWHWQREAVAKYYGCAAHMDKQIGALLSAVEVLRLTASTSVVVQGDHGFSLGRHGRWSKYHLYEDATRIPLIIAVHGQGAAVVNDVVEAVDVLPTLLDLWGVKRVPAPTAADRRGDAGHDSLVSDGSGVTYALPGHASGTVHVDGESLMPFLRPSSRSLAAVSTAAVRRTTYARSELRMGMVIHRPTDPNLPGAKPQRNIGSGAQLYVRTSRYAYTVYLGLGSTCGCGSRLSIVDEALFDHTVDMGEMRNLAYITTHAAVRTRLLALVLRDWQLADLGMMAPNRSARMAHINAVASCLLDPQLAGRSCQQPPTTAARLGSSE